MLQQTMNTRPQRGFARLMSSTALAGLATTLALTAPLAAHAQAFVPIGPGIEVGVPQVMNGADGPNNRGAGVAPSYGTQSGAIQTVVVDPFQTNLLLAGSPNGGIWRSTDGGLSWTAQTDQKGSLSIGGISFDLSDTSGQTAIAGVAVTSSGTTFGVGGGKPRSYFDIGRGGSTNNGLLLTTDGGATWQTISVGALPDIGILNASVRGSTIMAAAFNEEGSWTSGSGVEAASGLYRSTDGGKTFSKLGAGAGLPTGAATALVGDPGNPNHFYVAISTAGAGNSNDAGTALYTSYDGGASWSKVFGQANASAAITSSDPTILRVATGPNGTVAVGVVDGFTGQMRYAYLSKDNGSTWHDLSVALDPATLAGTAGPSNVPDPDKRKDVFGNGSEAPTAINPGGQAAIHSVIAIDPNNPNVVYMAGDRLQNFGQNGYSANAMRAQLNADGSVTYAPLTDSFTADGSTAHPDCRSMTFDANGNLIMATDGGIYYRTSPQTTQGAWYGMNNGRQALETYSMALDPSSGLVAVAAQDNGAGLQAGPKSNVFNQVWGGDGTVALINGVTQAAQGASYVYVSSQYLAGGVLGRFQFDHSGNITSNEIDLYFYNNTAGYLTFPAFVPKVKLNNIDPSYMALGAASGVYVAQDTFATPTPYTPGDTACVNGCYNILPASYAGHTGYVVTALDFGTRDNQYALLAGSTYGGSRLFVSTGTSLATMSLKPVASYMSAFYNGNGALAPTAVLFDPRSQMRFFAADSNLLYGTTDGGVTGQVLNANLPANFTRPESLGFISTNGVNALLVGGINTADNAGNPLIIADSDANGVLSNWRRFGTGLPNTQVNLIDYEASLDALAIGTYGRGVFMLYDVTSNFAQATVLQFGLANNDSAPSASILTGNRPLYKYGTGTLTLSGAPSFTGTVFLENGLTQISADANLGAASNGLVFDGGALRTLAGVTSARGVTLNAGNGLIDTYGFNSTFSGAFAGVGGLIKAGQGRLTLSGVNTYTGGTAVMGGELALQGTLSGTTYVGPAGVLSGSGLNTGPLFLGGGVVRPGGAGGVGGLIAQAVSAASGPGALTVGSFSAPAGGVLQISFNGPSSTQLNVLGAANITGVNLSASLAAGGSLRFDQRYVVLSSGGLTGAFTNAAGWSPVGASSPGSVERLRYDLVANSVVLEVLTPLDWTQGATNVNQRNVGALFNATQLTGSDAWIAGLNAVSGNSSSDRLANLEAVSGEGDVDARFLSTSVDRKFNELVASRLVGGDLTGAPRTFAENTLRRFTPGAASMMDLAGVAAAGGVTRNTSDQAWTQVYLVNDKLSTGLAPTKATGAGLGAGYDVVLGSGDLRVGFAVAYAQGDERTLSLGTHATGDYWQGALYARKQYGPWLFGLSASATRGALDISRNLTLAGGGATIVTNGSTASTDLSLQALGARQFLFQGGWKLTASGVLQASRRDQSAFAEHGVGPFVLNVGSVRTADFEGLGELLLSRKFAAQGGVLEPFVGLVGGGRLGGDKSPDANIGFQGSPGSSVRILGAANVNSWAGASVGASFLTAQNLRLSARYEASLSNQLRESAAVFSLSTRW